MSAIQFLLLWLYYGSQPAIRYADAFEDEEEQVPASSLLETSAGSVDATCTLRDDGQCGMLPNAEITDEISAPDSSLESASSCQNSPGLAIPLRSQQQYGMYGLLTPEEAADHLELPEGGGGSVSQQRNSGRNKDTYYFYQGMLFLFNCYSSPPSVSQELWAGCN